MSTIVSIATAVPEWKHSQKELFHFIDKVYGNNAADSRKMRFRYQQSGIDHRYTVVPDYSSAGTNAPQQFYNTSESDNHFPTIEQRMRWYAEHAPALSQNAIEKCVSGYIDKEQITHLITVSCTGMSAPGLDLHLVEQMKLPSTIMRSSVNFMGCYAAIHAIKMADAFCKADPDANIVIVCTELCSLHFQKEPTPDNITSSLLFADGAAALLMQGESTKHKGISLTGFFSEVAFNAKKDMTWEISSTGFQMTLTGYVPELLRADFSKLVNAALSKSKRGVGAVTHWCIHPGGKKILEAIGKSLEIDPEKLRYSYEVLREYGNMSAPTLLFVLQKILNELNDGPKTTSPLIFAAAFGPGLTMETFTATYA